MPAHQTRLGVKSQIVFNHPIKIQFCIGPIKTQISVFDGPSMGIHGTGLGFYGQKAVNLVILDVFGGNQPFCI